MSKALVHALACWLRRLSERLLRRARPIPDALWHDTLARHPFLARLSPAERARLRLISTHFLARKRFSGAHGLVVTDAMAVAVAAQACLPLLHLGPPERPQAALSWYNDFVGIVLHPSEAVARRQAVDGAGVVHHYAEVLAGEAMQHGPVMLSWPAVQGQGMGPGSSVVIHEFMHKIDMRSGRVQGAPPLPEGFMGTHSAREAAALWANTWKPAYEDFCDQLIRAERFGQPMPWLDPYAASAPEEFFAVACEAHFTEPERFAQEHPALAHLLRAFFRQPQPPDPIA